MSDFKKIQQNIHKFIKKYFLNELFKGIILFIVFTFFYLLITAFIEYIFWLPSLVREYLYYAQWLVLILFFVIFILSPLLNLFGVQKKLSEEKAAIIIGNFFPEIKDKLLNTLQLHNQSEELSDLLLASIKQKSDKLSRFSFSKAVNFKKNYKYLPLLLVPFVILLLLKIAHLDKDLSNGYERVLSYNKKFTPPLPFSIVISDSLQIIQGSDYKLQVKLIGKKLPANLFIQIENEKHSLLKENDSIFTFYFPLIQETIKFKILDEKHDLGYYKLEIIKPPVIEQFNITVFYPKYLHKKPKKYFYTADISVPESSLIQWKLKTLNTDSIYFSINKNKYVFPVKNDSFFYKKIATKTFTYNFKPINKKIHNLFSDSYKIEIIKDELPKISVIEKKDTVYRQNYYHITASDDYGLVRLQLVYINKKTGKLNKLPLPITHKDFIVKNFVFPGNIDLEQNSTYEYYFQVFDNDYVHNYKSTRSKTFYYHKLSYKQLEELNIKQQEQTINQLDKIQQQIIEQKEDINNVRAKITRQKSIDWQSKKQLEKAIKQSKQQEEFFKQALNKYKRLLDKLPDDKKSNNKEELKKRLEELEQMNKKKKLLDELKQLAEQLKKENLIEKLKELKNYSEHQEKSLERILELTKKYYIQQKIKKISEQLDTLSKKQSNLSKKLSDTSEQQKDLNRQMDKINKQMDSIQKINKKLKNPMKIPDIDIDMEEIKMDMKKSLEQLQQQKQQQANHNQSKAANKMKQLSKNMMTLMMSGAEEQQGEDIKTLQALLKSLLIFSFKEENLLTKLYSHKGKQYLSQQLLTQNQLKTYFKHINDSLYTLALRNPKITQKILDESFEIENNLNKTLSYLSDNEIFNTQNTAQYILKGANSLADFLSNALNQMKNSMQAMGKGKGKKSKGDSFSLPDIIKKQRESISQMQQQMKNKQGKKSKNKDIGKKNKGKEKKETEGESEKQYKLYKQQQHIKESLEQMRDKFSDKSTQKKIKKIIKQMDELQKRLLREGITQSTLNKMIQLQYELLKLKNATFIQHEDNKRQSKTNFNKYKGIDSLFFHDKLKFDYQNEQLKKIQIPVNQKVKNKIYQYSN